MTFPDPHPAAHETAAIVHHPVPLAPIQPAPLLPTPAAGAVPIVQTVQLPDGRIVTGYALTPPPTDQPRPVVNRTAATIALGGVGFAAVCGGLVLLTGVIAALAAFVHQLIILAAVIFGGWVAVQVFGHGDRDGGTTVNIRKAVFKRNHFHG